MASKLMGGRQRHQNRKLLEAINAAYADGPDADEAMLARYRRDYHRRLVEGEEGGQYFSLYDKWMADKAEFGE